MPKLKNSNFLMTKRSKRRQNKDQAGCMSGLISVFDFCHGRINRQMLSDPGKHLPENNDGLSYPTSESNLFTNSEDIHLWIESRKREKIENPTFDPTHTRVKELMEEEIADEQTDKITSNPSSDDHEISIDQVPTRKATHFRDLDDLMNELLMIHRKRNEEQKSKSKPIERSNSFSNERIDPRSDEPATRKPGNFFRRRSKSHECISFNETESTARHKRSVSQFSFIEIKKRIKNAIGKDGRNPGCIENFPRISKPREKEDSGNTIDRISNIYVEAKKHLSEMLKTGDEDSEIMIGKLPKTLGNILSFPEYNSLSPEYNTPDAGTSPRNELDHGLVTMVNESHPFVADEDFREPEVSDKVYQAEDILEIVKPPSPEKSRVVVIPDLTEEIELSCSPIASPSGSSPSIYRKNEETGSSADDRTGKPSPVSVLDPFFSDEDVSPARTVFRFVEASIQPLRIQFEETLTPIVDQEICIRNHVENEESTFEYVEAVLLASDLNWAEFETKWLSSTQILDPSLFHELELFSSRTRLDQRLLFDSVNEILKGVCDRSLGLFPDLSIVKPIPKGMGLIKEVWERIELQIDRVYSRSLDQLVKKDLEVSRTWIDLRSETAAIVIEIEESVFDDMIDDMVSSLMDD